MSSNKLQEQLNSMLTTADLCRMFQKTPMTIHLWRKNKGLPAVVIPGGKRPTVRFVAKDVIRWAKKNGYEIKVIL